MTGVEIMRSLCLPDNPVGSRIKITVRTTEGNFRSFTVTINGYRIGPGYVEFTISSRSIKKISFDRLLCRTHNGKIVGNFLALAKIPAPEEDDWIKSWDVTRFEPVR